MRLKQFFQLSIFLMVIFLFFNPIININIYAATDFKTPKDFFGFIPGADRMLFSYEDLVGYLKQVDARSPRLKLIEIGTSPMGKTIYIACISSETNISRLTRLKEINKRLALESDMSDRERESLIQEGRVFVLATLSMHSGEVGPSQAAPLIAYNLVTTEDPELLEYLNNVVFLMVPCHNPDGMDMVVQHYHKYRG
ncbi:MAG: hypothetical protein KAT17_00540, partial [Candidatus Aminicenantes bacterium]|nr:hypothetical protein [Candidatus Aminicenantes bacterium]